MKQLTLPVLMQCLADTSSLQFFLRRYLPSRLKMLKLNSLHNETFLGYCLSLLQCWHYSTLKKKQELLDVYSINSFQRRYLVGTIYFNIFNLVLQQLHYKVKSTFWYLPSPGSLVEARPVCKLDAHFEGMMPKMVRAILNKFKGLLG